MQLKDISKTILAKIDIVELISAHITIKKAGKEFHACCPFHQEKTPSFTISPQKQFFYCFGCQAKGDAISFTMQYHQLTFKEALLKLAKDYHIPLPSLSSNESKIDRSLYKIMRDITLACKQDVATTEHVKQYLDERNISSQALKQYHIGYCGTQYKKLMQSLMRTNHKELEDLGMLSKSDNGSFRPKFYQRLMFPIQDTTGKVIGFGGRVMDKRQPKYLNSPETLLFKKRYTLYGMWQYKHTKAHTVYIVEGYMDVVALASNGVENSVACLGTAFTESHWLILRRLTQKAIFCFDGDNAGKKAAWLTLERILPALQPHNHIHFMFLPSGEDPDSLINKKNGKQLFTELSEKSITWDQYMLANLQSLHPGDSVNAKASYQKALTELANKLTDKHLQQALLSKINLNQPKKTVSKAPKKNSNSNEYRITCEKIILTLANKNTTWSPNTYFSKLPCDDTMLQIIHNWLSACTKEPTITGDTLLSKLRETQAYEQFVKIQNTHTPQRFSSGHIHALLCDLSIYALSKNITMLLEDPATLSATERQILQELIKEKKQVQTLKITQPS